MYRYRLSLALLIALLPATTLAQEAYYPPDEAEAPQSPTYAPQQLDQLIAPIALYPDPLLGQILMASTYPLEVVEAARWRQQPANASLQGSALTAALEAQSWDPSVKSVAAVPQVLQLLDSNLQWTEQLGDAFLAQQGDVMNEVQQLRQRAEAAHTLASTPQQSVSTQDGAIVIEPANPDTLYVPYYNPETAYGAWPYPDYAPYYFPGYDTGAALLGFGAGVAILAPFWGWDSWDWRHHRIHIDDRRYAHLNRGRSLALPGQWQHDPAHRHGVPYQSPGPRARFEAQAAANRRNVRGYAPQTVRAAAPNIATPERPIVHPTGRPVHANPTPPVVWQAPAHAETPHIAAPTVERAPAHAAPLFESYSRGAEVRAQSARGAFSRGGHAGHAPAARPAGGPVHAGGGGHGGSHGGGHPGDNRR